MAAWGEPRFFVDESALGLGKALAYARRDVVYAGHPLIPAAPLGAADVHWIEAVGALDLIVISRDKRMLKRPAEKTALLENRIRGIWIGGKKDIDTWEALGRLFRYWGKLEQLIVELGPGPWFLMLNAGGAVLNYPRLPSS